MRYNIYMLFAIIGLVLGYVYTYITAEDKIKSKKFNLYMYKVIGFVLVFISIEYLWDQL